MEKNGIFTATSSLKNLEIQKYFQDEPRFNWVFSRDNLPEKTKDGDYVINLDKSEDVGTHWIALFSKRSETVYFDSVVVEYVPKEIKKFIEHKSMKANIFRIQANNSILCGYFCIGFIDFMLAGEKPTDFTSLFSPCDLKKNDDIILIYFKGKSMQSHWNWQNKLDWPNIIQIKWHH